MNTRPLASYASVGIVHFMAFPECLQGDGPIIETLTTIAEDPFFTAIEITRIDDPTRRRSAATLLRAAGLTIGFGCQPMLLGGRHDLNSLDDTRRRAAIDTCLAGLEHATELGATTLAVLSGPDPAEGERPAAIDALVDSLTELGHACTSAGLRLCLETFDRDIDKRCLVGPNQLAADVSHRVRTHVSDFGLLIDLSHLPLQHEGIHEALHVTRDHLSHVHIGNCVLEPHHPLYGDQHPRFGYPGGANDVEELRTFLETLLDIGYLAPDARATVAFEVKPAPDETSTTLIAQSQRTLLHAWSTLANPHET
jgi:sugar phosphate isomerase/epimerase